MACCTSEYRCSSVYCADDPLLPSSLVNDDCTEALQRIFPKINMGVIDSIIDETEGLSDLRRNFYKVMLHARYSQILESAYTKLQADGFRP